MLGSWASPHNLGRQAGAQSHGGLGGDFLNQRAVNVSGNEAAKGNRRANVRLTDGRAAGATGRRVIRLPGPSVLGSEFRSQSAELDGITMHSMALRHYSMLRSSARPVT